MLTKQGINFIQRFFRTLRTEEQYLVGRWNNNDNRDLKAMLASMDSCGDSLCGKPDNFKKEISKILKEK